MAFLSITYWLEPVSGDNALRAWSSAADTETAPRSLTGRCCCAVSVSAGAGASTAVAASVGVAARASTRLAASRLGFIGGIRCGERWRDCYVITLLARISERRRPEVTPAPP